MPHDPALLAETAAWLIKAAKDLRAAEVDRTATPPLLEDALFHCQQVVEKTLKGFLVWNGQPFPKTHSLEEIGERCLAIDPTLRALVDRAVPLTEYAWAYRYPGEPGEPTQQEVDEVLPLAKEVYMRILGLLPEEVRP